MLFRRLLEAPNENADSHLHDMQKQLKGKIEKAKTLSASLKVNSENDDQYVTSATGELIYPEFRPETNYNEQFWKTYLKNELSFAMIKEVSEKTSQLQDLVKEIQALQQQYFRLFKLRNRKKNRRLAAEIQKKFECPYNKCYKIYGSDVSLNLHIKLKHNGGNKTDRQKLAEEICIAELNGSTPPEIRLNLPPGFLEQYKRQNHFIQKIKIIKQQNQNQKTT